MMQNLFKVTIKYLCSKVLGMMNQYSNNSKLEVINIQQRLAVTGNFIQCFIF